MTILEAQVAPDKWAALQQAYQEGTRNLSLDPGLVQTFLIHGLKEPNLWRILTVWQSREALDKMRQSGETPRGVLMFRAAGAEPTLAVFDVAAQRAA
ncbi:MAG: antibiotic biosynthesis monooxygenase [Chloroflexota bacterium]|nr:antibiotic biosynthesis monooxygenase [Chloroflexota bacterium]